MFKTILTCLILASVNLEAISAETDKVICYYASWATTRPGSGKVTPEDLDPNLCTHINYAFLGLTEDGSLEILDPENDIEQGNLKKVSDLKKINSNLKCLLSIGGWSASTAVFLSVATDPVKRANMAKSAIEFMQKYNYDGIDVDWEYPYDKENYVNLLRELKQEFEPHGYLLTVAVAAIPTDAAYDVPSMTEVLDIINVMTYDFHGAWAGFTAQNSPLYSSSSEGQWQADNLNCNSSITHWILEGAQPEKLTIGIAFYGKSFILSDPNNYGLGAPSSGPTEGGEYTQNIGTLGYNEICEFHSSGEILWDDEQQVPYLHDGEVWVGFDNPKSVALKAQYAIDNKLAGVMIWSIETDDYHSKCGNKLGLLNAINNVIN
ncbi:acidic mammalian chitinase-like [Aethina tumida]|uniref:acidic mammalian chitinase-like n=1 Tax=Aethina tumida TaxID=116153 RepID=UPI0021483BF6|nr:acidic mammalian chitinase-like [Aethina tumida]